jgi:hypothetical protein
MPLTLDGTNGITQSTSFKSNTYLDAAGGNTATINGTLIPASGVTLVSTAATQTLTNKSIAASQLTGALPAIDGSALTGIVTGGMTLLGTLTTTSGTTQTLSSLNLSTYTFLYISVASVAYSSAGSRALLLSGGNMTGLYSAGDNVTALAIIQLLSAGSPGFTIAGTNGSLISTQQTSSGYGITTASTSMSFTWTGTVAFTQGAIRVYGGK